MVLVVLSVSVFSWYSGLLPKSLDEWRHLLDLLLSRDHHGNDSRHSSHSCTPLSASDWLPDLTWSNVINLMLERLGAGHTVNLLQALPRDMPLLTTDFYYSCLLGAVIERRQRLVNLLLHCLNAAHSVFNKLTSVFHASVLLLIMNFFITLSK